MECYEEEEDCCDKVALASSGLLQSVHPDILDTYSFYTGHFAQHNPQSLYPCAYRYNIIWLLKGKNGRTVYRSSSGRHYLYYEDWGSNQGANWVVAASYSGDTPVLASSPNLEHAGSVCVDTLHQVSRFCACENRLQL